MDKERAYKLYNNLIPYYSRLSDSIRTSIEFLISQEKIDILEVQNRVKEFDSFFSKIERKKYSDPFNEIEDICGIRVICYYPDDVQKIGQLIKNNFVIHSYEDKIDTLTPFEFGYRSTHYIISINKEWQQVPNFRDLEHMRAEIQVRTILMHAWADISHKLAYKKMEHVNPKFQRKLSQLSALFEIADENFEKLREERKLFQEEVSNKIDSLEVHDFDLDTLQAFLDHYFPDRERSLKLTVDLLDELLKYDITFDELKQGYEKARPLLTELENEEVKQYLDDGNELRGKYLWAQVGIIRTILDLTNETYFKDRHNDHNLYGEIIFKYRNKLF